MAAVTSKTESTRPHLWLRKDCLSVRGLFLIWSTSSTSASKVAIGNAIRSVLISPVGTGAGAERTGSVPSVCTI